jgi:hypothetical protein
MGSLIRKLVRSKTKNGKTYMRSVYVKAEKPRGSLNWRMGKMGVISGFAGGVGAYHAGKRAHEHGQAIPGMIAGSVVGSALGRGYYKWRNPHLMQDYKNSTYSGRWHADLSRNVGSTIGHVAGLAFAYRRDNKPDINWTHGNDR